MMVARKKTVCYRLDETVLMCLERLEAAGLGYHSKTDIVEQAIVHEWERHFGLVDTEHELEFGL